MFTREDEKRRILVFADYFEPGYRAGGPIKTLKNIFSSLNNIYKFYIITRNYDAGEEKAYPFQDGMWIDKGDYQIFYCADKNMTAETVDQQIRQISPSIIYLNSFFSWHYSIKIIMTQRRQSKIILAPRGEFSEGALKIKKGRKLSYLQIARILRLYNSVTFHASSELEANDIRTYLGDVKLFVAPDMVCSDVIHKESAKIKDELTLCFVSRISAKKNLLYCIEALSRIETDNRRIKFDIYGPIEDQKYWSKCQSLIYKYHLQDTVKYCGVIAPDLVANTISSYNFLFFPTLGENFGHVIFESLSAGTPVILANTTFWNQYDKLSRWGFIFDLEQKDRVTDILNECYEMSEKQYETMSNNALAVAKLFSEDKMLRNQTASLFAQSIGS